MARNARDDEEKPRKRFSRSGHTSHGPRTYPPAQSYPPAQPPQYPSQPYPSQPYPPQQYPPQQYPPQQYPPQQYPPQYDPYAPPGSTPNNPIDQFGRSTYHRSTPIEEPPSSPAVAMTRAAIQSTNRAARLVTRKVISASKADGAEESGLTALIWNQVLSYGTDAMITVALAGTVFFGASSSAQRGNVLLYLLVTMAPFAIVAPIIGPALDRLAHGRRWTMAGTAIGRGILALFMASHPSELLILYPCALGSLVLSKAYGVVRANAAPRLVPPGLTLTEVNARLSIFGLGSTIVLGAVVGLLIKITGSYSLGLYVTAAAFFVCAFFAFRLPPQIDTTVDVDTIAPYETPPLSTSQLPRPLRVPPTTRIRSWATRGFADDLIVALQGESVLRFLSGLLTIYMAFFITHESHGVTAAAQLGGVVGAAGFGNFVGTAIGTKLKLTRPDLLIIGAVVIAGATELLIGLVWTIVLAAVGMFVSAVTNALSKIALDALIQRDVVESLRSSAFARSETFLQLAWVLGAAIGVVLPVTHGGWLGYIVAGVIVGTVGVLIVLRYRLLLRTRRRTPTPGRPVA